MIAGRTGIGAGAPNVPAIEMHNVSKRYGAVQALRDVSLIVRKGTVHAVLGENGAGKSTLIEILGGNVLPDTGVIKIDGEPVRGDSGRSADKRPVAIVHQHLSLASNVTVAENLLVGQSLGRYGLVGWKRLFARAQKLLDEYRIPARADDIVGDLSLAVQQQVEIARALSANAGIIALDEPTSSLSIVESRALLKRLADLRASGRTIIIITHHIADAFAVADNGTVLRDGQLAGHFSMSSVSEKEVVRMMIGREVASLQPRRQDEAPVSSDRARGLEVSALVSGKEVGGATMHAAPGEVVGLYGLVGSGRSELLQTIFGLRARQAGTITLNGERFRHAHAPGDAIAAGMALLPEDRIAEGLFASRSVAENISAVRLRDFGRWFIGERGLEEAANKYIRSLEIKGTARTPVEQLSGGNQQKVLFARWLSTKPGALMVDEPTRGVDVGTKAQIHLALRALAAEGRVIVMASSELPEILGVSDRIYVMAAGRIVDEVAVADATSERLLESASQMKRDTLGEVA